MSVTPIPEEEHEKSAAVLENVKQIIPFNGCLIIQPSDTDSAEALKKAGLIVPDTHADRPSQGHIVAKADTCKLNVERGDRVLFTKYGGNEFELHGMKLLILSEADILCKIA